MQSLDLQLRRESGAAILTLEGQLDGNTPEAFGQFMLENLLESDRHLILDATRLSFISSAGLRECLKLAKRLDKAKLKATLVGLAPSVALAFEIAGFNTLFNQFPTLASALNPDAKLPRRGLFGQFFS